MAIFKPGQLVGLNDWYGESVELYSVPGGTTDVRGIGRLNVKDVAMVIAIGRSDGSQVYVLGPAGGGWTFGALLKILKEPAI